MLKLTYEFKSEEEMQDWLSKRNADPAKTEETPTPTPTPTPAAKSDDDDPTRDDVDADGMPYNESYHSDPPAFTSKGLWRAKRGCTDEANEARAKFKASGGNVADPDDVADRSAPETPPAPAAAAPGAAPAAAPEARAPVTIDQLFAKITEMLEAEAISREQLFEWYRTTTGLTASDSEIAAAAGPVFQVNETARADLMDILEAV